MKKHILWLAAALTLLFCMALPAAAEGEEETIPAPSPAAEDAVTLIPEEALAVELVDSIDLGARERVETAYQEALQLTGRKSFRGYCGSYVNHLLMVYGINTSYISGNGNRFSETIRTGNAPPAAMISGRIMQRNTARCWIFSSPLPMKLR